MQNRCAASSNSSQKMQRFLPTDKAPGRVQGPVLPTRSDRQSFIKDLTKITRPELMEILEREERLLRNRTKLERLPDKGQKIRDYHAKVQAEICRRNEVDSAADLFSQLNIASVGKQAVNNLEWTGSTVVVADGVVDSDDDEDVDPLKILAGSNEVNKIIKIEKPQTLITAEDLCEIESFKADEDKAVENFGIRNKTRLTKLISKIETKTVENENEKNEIAVLLEPHALYLCEIELHNAPPSKPKYLPSRTTRTDVHKPETEMKRRQRKNWEATAATPPLFRHTGVKQLSLQESIEAQKKNFDLHTKLQTELTQERLAQREIRMRDRTIVNCINDDLANFADYRDPAYESPGSDDEVHDDEDDDRGGINFDVET